MIATKPGTLLFVLALTLMPLAAHAEKQSSLHLDNVWARATPPGVDTGAGYLTIHNHGGQADRLIGARTPVAEQVEIHRSSEKDGMTRMEKVGDGLAVPADGMVQLSPGGYHLMLMGLEGQLSQGDSHELTLKFEQGGEKTVTLQVRAHDSDDSNGHEHHH